MFMFDFNLIIFLFNLSVALVLFVIYHNELHQISFFTFILNEVIN